MVRAHVKQWEGELQVTSATRALGYSTCAAVSHKSNTSCLIRLSHGGITVDALLPASIIRRAEAFRAVYGEITSSSFLLEPIGVSLCVVELVEFPGQALLKAARLLHFMHLHLCLLQMVHQSPFSFMCIFIECTSQLQSPAIGKHRALKAFSFGCTSPLVHLPGAFTMLAFTHRRCESL